MPTFDTTQTFRNELSKLTREQRQEFKEAVAKLVEDLAAVEADPSASIRAGLRVKPYRSERGVLEMSWSGNGRALFEYGDKQVEGKTHVIWLRVGTHDIF